MLAAVLRGGELTLQTSLRSWRALSSIAYNGSYRLLKSPPLVSLDLLEDWTRRVDQDHLDNVAIPKTCKLYIYNILKS